MQEKEFIALVDRLESYAHENPGTYKLRVALLAALGYLFLFGIMGAVLLIVLGFVYAGKINYLVIKILIIPLGLAAIVVRSLWITFPRPEGHELKYDDAPRFFDLLREVRTATDGPTLHKVLLTDDYNAGIVQRPRLGVLGWRENYLLVGLPLLRALSPTDVRAVMAHEFGHLSGNHGKFSSWIYGVRQTWTQIMENVQQHGRHGAGIFKRFFDWYAPYFGAYSFVLARAQEYEADRCSVGLVGKENAARALVKLELKERALNEDFWPGFYKRADKQADPPGETFSEMLQSLHEPLAPDRAKLWFVQSLNRRHRYDDTHPALADRLESMGFSGVRKDADFTTLAAADDDVRGDQYFLANLPAGFVEGKDRWWKEQLATGWAERHKFVLEAEKKLAEFEEKVKTTELTVEERWERASFMAGTQGNVAAIPFLNDVLALMPEHAAANYTLGQALLEQGDEAGIKKIEAAMEKDVHGIPAGCETIYYFLTTRERTEEAEKYRQCIADYYEQLALATEERNNITTKDQFTEHGLDQAAVEALRAQLESVPDLASAHLVKKVVQHFPEDPSYVLGVIAKHAWYSTQSNKRDQELIEVLASTITYPGFTYIIAMERDFKGLRKIFKRIPGSEIFNARH